MKNNTLIVVGLILVIVVCIIFILSYAVSPVEQPVLTATNHNTTSQTKSQVLPKADYIIYYTDSGFSPNTIQVEQGKLVRFVNNSSRALLIKADSNAAVPNELDQSKSIGKGSVYNFDFTHVGVWAFHNEDYPADHANLVVY